MSPSPPQVHPVRYRQNTTRLSRALELDRPETSRRGDLGTLKRGYLPASEEMVKSQQAARRP